MSSKLYKTYITLKIKNPYNKYLFKSGIFYIFLDEDAKELHKILNLKLSQLNSQIVKCGFPVKSITKYMRILKENGYSIEIIDFEKKSILNYTTLMENNKIAKLLEQIANTDVDSLSISKSFDLLKNFKQESEKILKQF